MTEEINLNKTVVHVFRILDAINSSESPQGVSELTRSTDLPKTTVFRLLTTLEHLGVVDSNSTQQYKLGSKVLGYSKSASRQNSLIQLAKPYMQKYAEKQHENINIGILYENQVLYLDSEEGDHFNLQVNLFPVAPLYCSSMGKIFLSQFSESDLNGYLNETNLKRRTINTLDKPEKLKQELKEIKKTGVSYDNEEYEYGLTCIAVPIIKSGKVIAAASVSGPTSRLKVRGWDNIRQSIIEFGELMNNLL